MNNEFLEKPSKDYWDLIKQTQFSKRDLIDIYIYCREADAEHRLTPLLSCGILDMSPLTPEAIRWAQEKVAKGEI
jgi:hypothetical protein